MDSTATRPLALVTGASSGDGFEPLMAGKERVVSASAEIEAQPSSGTP